MRMYVRAFLTKGWGVDDFLLIVAVVGSRGSAVYLMCISGLTFTRLSLLHIAHVLLWE
jgi:hypothetical protein